MTSRKCGKATSFCTIFVLAFGGGVRQCDANCNPVRPCHGARIFPGLQGVQAGAMRRTLAAKAGPHGEAAYPHRHGAIQNP
jgi:hypothetical protein